MGRDLYFRHGKLCILISTFELLTTIGFCQERPFSNKTSEIKLLKNTNKIIENSIEAINKIKNGEYISERKSTIPYLPTVFADPYIQKRVISVNKKDTIQGAAFQFYVLQDSFELRSIYDGENYLSVDDGKKTIWNISKNQYPNFLGAFHLFTQAILKTAIARKAEIDITSSLDSIKISILFKDLYIEFTPIGVHEITRDTVGFNSQYTIYIDPNTFLPLKTIRKLPHSTSIETILYQNLNFADTIIISALDPVINKKYNNVDTTNFKARFTNTKMPDWNLVEVDGDSISFNKIKGKRCVVTLNSVGWKSCEQAASFLKEFRKTHSRNDVELVSIEPYINNALVLKNYKKRNEIKYPLLIADRQFKKYFSIADVPIFMLIDKNGVIKKIIIGFNDNTINEIETGINNI